MQTEFMHHSPASDHVSLSCLTAVKNLQETGRYGEAKDELEKVVLRSKVPREQGQACLLLAELFNKWGAASPNYSLDIMERGAKYASNAVQIFNAEIEKTLAEDDTGPHTADERLLRESLYWKALNMATIGGLGGLPPDPSQSEGDSFLFSDSLNFAFDEAEDAFMSIKNLRQCKRTQLETMGLKGSELFLEGTMLFCRAKALQAGHIKTDARNGKTHEKLWQQCLEMYLESYNCLSGSRGQHYNETVKAVTMIAVCNLLLGQKEEAIEWATKEVELRVRLFGDWNPRTQRAQHMLANLMGTTLQTDGAGEEYEEGETNRYPLDFVAKEDIVWGVDPFQQSDKWRISACLQMFQSLGLILRFAIHIEKLTKFVIKCKESYRKDNAFHNWIHAWSVTHCAYMILSSTHIDRFLKANEILSIMVSCLVHDIDHPGVNSDFLIKSGSALALKFPYKNVLEQMHWFNAKQMFEDGCETDFLEFVSPGVKEEILMLVHEGIMATDMQNHKAIVDALSVRCSRIDLSRDESEPGDLYPGAAEHTHARSPLPIVYDIQNDSDRLELLQAIVHASDLSGQALDKDVAYSFGRGVLTEFHMQSARESCEKLPKTPFMVNLHSILMQAKAQLGFLNFVVEPLWKKMCCIFPEIKERHHCVLDRLGEIDFDALDEWGGKCDGLQPVDVSEGTESLMAPSSATSKP